MQLDLFETSTTNILVSHTYTEFKTRLKSSNCSKCPSLSESRHNIVVDRGNPESKLVLIGEAPGENEDLEGADIQAVLFYAARLSQVKRMSLVNA